MGTSSLSNKKQLALKISRLYYEDGISQSDIATKLKISRPTISRLLNYAKEIGMVQVKVIGPKEDLGLLQIKLKEKYRLKDVLIAENYIDDVQLINKKLGNLAATFLNDIVNDDDIIGISWGETMNSIANNLIPSTHHNVQVVQLKGSMSESDVNDHADEINHKFSKAFHTNTMTLPLPVFLDNMITKNIVIKDRFIKRIYEIGKQSNIAIFTTGTVQEHALLFSLGYLNQEEIATLQKTAVGDIVSHFIDADGKIVDNVLDNRTIGIPLPELRNKDFSILVSGSTKKLPSIRGALKGRYANVLITDEQTARDLLND